jgi:hypothetical protein
MEPLFRLLQAAANSTSTQPAARKPISNIGHVHYHMMVIVWLALGTIGLWSTLFKQYKWATYLHVIVMGVLIVASWMSGFLAFINYGFTDKIGYQHVEFGMSILFGLVVQGGLGAATWVCQKSAKVPPYCVYIINQCHRLFGYAIYIMVLIECAVFLSKDSK